MAELESVEAYLQGESPDAVGLFRQFEELVRCCGPCETAPRSSVVYRKRSRIFVGAFIHGRRLELVVDLLRDAGHPRANAAFATSKRVVTNRLRITRPGELDESVAALVAEAHEAVGPGTRQAAALH